MTHVNHGASGNTSQSTSEKDVLESPTQTVSLPNGNDVQSKGNDVRGNDTIPNGNDVLQLQGQSVKSLTVQRTKERKCGCGSCQPSCLQACAVPSCFLFFMCGLVFTQSCLVSGFSSSILTTIERRYNLRSSELGFIISSYDMTAVIAGIFVSYFGDAHNRAHWISRGAFLIAIGSIGFSLPHFIGKHYEVLLSNNNTSGDLGLCNATQMLAAEQCGSEAERLRDPEQWAFWVFIASFMLIGFGASPVYTLGPTYLYDNVRTDRYPVYSGIMYSMGALGPAAGFLFGGALLELFVHPGEAPLGLTSSSSQWVGAWWIGFLGIAGLALMIAIPLSCFPKELPGAHHSSGEDRPAFASFGSRIKDFPKNVGKLLKNKTWLMVTLASVVEQSIGTGFNRYIAKYIELSFDLPPTTANILTGCVLIPAAVLGIISGGVLMKRLNPSMSGTAKLMILLNITPTIALGSLLALGCDTVHIVGITDAYTFPSQMKPQMIDEYKIEYKKNLTAACNAGCQCAESLYLPVCGSDMRTYYSPCHAGCTQVDVHHNLEGLQVKNYSSCACIYDSFIHTTSAANTGRCDEGCSNLVPFLCILFFVVFVTTCGQNPALMVTLRSVGPDSRSFALGTQNFFFQLLAYIPAPIYIGQIFDSQCLLWTEKCDDKGACLEYDLHRLPFVLFGTCLAMKFVTFLFLGLLLLVTKQREKNKKTYEVNESVVTGETGFSSDSRSTSVSTISVKFQPEQDETVSNNGNFSLTPKSYSVYE